MKNAGFIKRKTYGLWIVLTVALIISVLLLAQSGKGDDNPLRHKTLTGVVLSYKETEAGLIMVLDYKGALYDANINITEDTLFTDEELERSIMNMTVGIAVTVESEYYVKTFDNIYPAVLISPDSR